MTREHTCCFIGHRKLPKYHLDEIRKHLYDTVRMLIAHGVDTFCTGGAQGFDTLAAQTVLCARKDNPHVRLVLLLTDMQPPSAWQQEDVKRFEHIKAAADEIIHIPQKSFEPCLLRRNRRLVDESAFCVCFMLAPVGGTYDTVDYCRKSGVTVLNIAQKIPNLL